MLQSLYKPIKVADFEATKLNFIGTGVAGQAAAGATTNIDYTVPDDSLLTGVQLNCQNQAFGDSVSFYILDKTGAAKFWNDAAQQWFSVPAGTVLNKFVSNWGLSSDWQRQVDENLPYPAKVYGGLTLRLAYTSKGLTAVNVAINYDLHVVLI